MTATVDVMYLEKLIRDSERLRVVEQYVESSSYVASSEIRAILGMPKRKENVNESV